MTKAYSRNYSLCCGSRRGEDGITHHRSWCGYGPHTFDKDVIVDGERVKVFAPYIPALAMSDIWRQMVYERLDRRLAKYDSDRANYPNRHRALLEISDALDDMLEK